MTDEKGSKEEYDNLRKIRCRQVKLENRAIRWIKSARNYFTRTVQNDNLGQLKSILGDIIIMCTVILASRETSSLGNYICRY